jgi:hypothetical protein
MKYNFTLGVEQWRVTALTFDPLSRWKLCVARNGVWRRLQFFPSPQEAMGAVANGTTGVASWDSAGHNPALGAESNWVAEFESAR